MKDLLLGCSKTEKQSLLIAISLQMEFITWVSSDSSSLSPSTEKTTVVEVSPNVEVRPRDTFDRWGSLTPFAFSLRWWFYIHNPQVEITLWTSITGK